MLATTNIHALIKPLLITTILDLIKCPLPVQLPFKVNHVGLAKQTLKPKMVHVVRLLGKLISETMEV